MGEGRPTEARISSLNACAKVDFRRSNNKLFRRQMKAAAIDADASLLSYD
jgi:hypothetical protein